MEREIDFVKAAAIYERVVERLLNDYPKLQPLHLDEDLAYSPIGSALQTWEGKPLIPDVFDRAAAMLIGLAQNQPLRPSGNKRAAWMFARLFLRASGYPLGELEWELMPFELMNGIADGFVDADKVADYLRREAGKHVE